MQAFAPRVLQLFTPTQLRAELERVGAEPSPDAGARAQAVMAEQLQRAEFRIVKLERIGLALARLLYQELVIEGGQVITAPRLEHTGAGETATLLCGTRYQFEHLLVRLRWQPSEELALLADELESALNRFGSAPPPFQQGAWHFDWGHRTYVMGILNLTPDSFSGDGLLQPGEPPGTTVERVRARARALVASGADLLDLGGESTRPGAEPVDAATELERVLPSVRALADAVRVPLSIDTSKAEVAAAALDAGADWVNDVTGLRGDPKMAQLVAARGAAIVITHNGRPDPQARDWLSALVAELAAQVTVARDAGIAPDHIILDPGLGFGKTVAQNLELINRLGELRVLGHALLIGPSRKGFIRKVLGARREAEAEAKPEWQGTAAAVTAGILRGADIVRVHDVAAMARVARLADALVRDSQSANESNPHTR